ncbi:MAG: QueT transporter family protein [Bacillota bacterium]|nr:QueT transporter family protein [Bacillota bacterium]
MFTKSKVRGITLAAVIAAFYTVLTVLPGISILSYGPLQFRISEALTVLPIFTPWAIPGLTIGCFVSNIFSTAGPMDMLFGTAASLIAAIATYLLRDRKRWIALIPPVVVNGVIIGTMITVFYMDAGKQFQTMLLYNMFTVAAGEAGVCYILGLPLAAYINRNKRVLGL